MIVLMRYIYLKLFPPLSHLQLFLGRVSLMSLSTKTVSSAGTIKKGNLSKKKMEKISGDSEIYSIIEQYSNKLWTSCQKNKEHYIGCKSLACEIANYICEDSKDIFVLESNPGPGILTEALLKLGVSNLRVFEKEGEFLPALKTLQKRFPGCLDIVNKDIMHLSKIASRDFYNMKDETSSFFVGLPKLQWENGIPCKFFAVILNSMSINFIRFLIAKLATMTSIFVYGRCQFYILFSEQEYKVITAKPQDNFNYYRAPTIFYNLFFHMNFIKKYPMSLFIPQKKIKHEKYLYFVKLTPREDLLTAVADRNNLPQFYFFVRHHLVKRKRLIIPCLEQWVPHCGPKFIKKGMEVFTKFGDLSPQQILQVFRQFSSLPEYKDSPFQAAVTNFYDQKDV